MKVTTEDGIVVDGITGADLHVVLAAVRKQKATAPMSEKPRTRIKKETTEETQERHRKARANTLRAIEASGGTIVEGSPARGTTFVVMDKSGEEVTCLEACAVGAANVRNRFIANEEVERIYNYDQKGNVEVLERKDYV